MKGVSLQGAYVLHRRPYRETSFLVDVFTPDDGRFTVVAKGVRKARSNLQGLLQSFTPLTISWQGNGELVTLTHTEMRGELKRLHGDCLFAGFYLNELLMILLQKWDPHPALFQWYEKTLTLLQADVLEEKYLRSFERRLLEELGYGLLPKMAVNAPAMILTDHYYRYVPEDGLVTVGACVNESLQHPHLFAGHLLLNIANENWQDSETLSAAKRLMRLILTPMLGNRSLHSRKLFARSGMGSSPDKRQIGKLLAN